MALELEKRKYSKQEVLKMVDAYRSEYKKVIEQQRTRISELLAERERILVEYAKIKNKEQLIVSTLERAEMTAKELSNQAQAQYQLEIERLRNFSERWTAYFKELRDKYPLYPTIQRAMEISDDVKKAEIGKDVRKILEEIDNKITLAEQEEKERFDPKRKISDYIVATSDGGFDMQEVLNPGELKLEELCKELGLIDENE